MWRHAYSTVYCKRPDLLLSGSRLAVYVIGQCLMQQQAVLPCPCLCSELVNTCVVAKKPVAARRAVDEMRAAGLGPDVIVLTSLMACYAAVGDVARTRGVLEEMRGAGVKPNAKSYTVLLQLMGNQGEQEGGSFRVLGFC